jgi:hypothetical protein
MVMLNARFRRASFRPRDAWLYVPLLLFSVSIAWRDSDTLKTFDLLAVLTILSLLTLRATGLRLRHTSLSRYVFAHVTAACNTFLGPFILLLGDIRWSKLPATGWSRHLTAVLRGLLIVTPLLVVFGLLLTAADAIFAGIINQSLHINFPTIVGHVALGGFLAWLAAGFLRGILLGGGAEFAWRTKAPAPATTAGPLSLDLSSASVTVDPPESSNETGPATAGASAPGSSIPSEPPARGFSLGAVEIGIVLGLLNILFLCFVIVQVRYLFGGAALVQSTTGLNYADYARNGFFQLVTVALLVLPILLSLHWLLPAKDARLEKLFGVLAGIQVALLFVIMASALKRMMLYQAEYGLTELRVYTTAFMGWLALVFGWFALTVLRGRRQRFVSGAILAGFTVLLSLHVINPEALIVQVNTARGVAGRPMDVKYLSTLSADAVPALIDAIPAMKHVDRCLAAGELLYRQNHEGAPDWRSWNWSRSGAGRRLAAQSAALASFGCPPEIAASPPSTRDSLFGD